MTVSQRAIIRAKNYILYQINTIEEEGMDRRGTPDDPTNWYNIDRMTAIRDVVRQIVAGVEPDYTAFYGGQPENFDDENTLFVVATRDRPGLIAVAPDMLALLQDIVASSEPLPPGLRDKIRAAIAKAEGAS